ncbi:hypothetical protein Q5752_002838 [Cryptotrichosporon argae]
MLEHILGRPSRSVRRTQVFLVLFFWVWRLYRGEGAARARGPPSHAHAHLHDGAVGRVLGARPAALLGRVARALRRWRGRWIGGVNRALARFSPYQLVLGTLTIMYTLRHIDDLVGVAPPEPLSDMYSRSYYRATYVNTAFDAGFATAMAVRPRWLRDICSVLFTGYYLVWANEGDEVLRRFRALPTVELLRTTWEKTNNPYVRLITALHRPNLPIVRPCTIPRPASSSRASLPPVKAVLFFAGTENELARATELVVDFPGGGFVAMGPDCHEERLRAWARRTGKPILGIDYGKAPEYPYPWAIEEGFDAYRTIQETRGRCIGIEAGQLSVVLTGDSAGGNICTTIMNRILEHHTAIPRPVSIVLAYPALDFNFTSWMSPTNLRVFATEQSEVNIPGIVHGKDHTRHKSPLSVVDDVATPKRGGGRHRRAASAAKKNAQPASANKSWAGSLRSAGLALTPTDEKIDEGGSVLAVGSASQPASPARAGWTRSLPRTLSSRLPGWLGPSADDDDDGEANGTELDEAESNVSGSDAEDLADNDGAVREADKSIRQRVKTPRIELDEYPMTASPASIDDARGAKKKKRRAPIGTRLTMTSRVGYFQDRIIPPTMMRAMAILYIGPRACPDFETDYYISPILSPPHLLAYFPPVYLICGERDPFVDDTVLFAGKIREAKRARRAQAMSDAPTNRAARFGESLRMTATPNVSPTRATGAGAGDGPSTSARSRPCMPTASRVPDRILREHEDDWVQVRILEGWGHGFMQMSAIMREVKPVLHDMADWIDGSFARACEVARDVADVEAAHAAALDVFTFTPAEGDTNNNTPGNANTNANANAPAAAAAAAAAHVADAAPPPPQSTHVRAAIDRGAPPATQALGKADLGTSLAADTDSDDTSGVLTFTPKTKKLKPKRRAPPPSRFAPVPRRPSKETLHRSSSAPRFDDADGELPTPATAGASTPASAASGARGTGTFAFFRGAASAPAGTPRPGHALPDALNPHSQWRVSGSSAAPSPAGGATPSTPHAHALPHGLPTNALVAAAVAGARAASPALAAAGLAPQVVGNLTEAELFRRRRLEATYGMGHTDSAAQSDTEDE